eukprot:6189453-Pleurochrysis_carterae.AAC.5
MAIKAKDGLRSIYYSTQSSAAVLSDGRTSRSSAAVPPKLRRPTIEQATYYRGERRSPSSWRAIVAVVGCCYAFCRLSPQDTGDERRLIGVPLVCAAQARESACLHAAHANLEPVAQCMTPWHRLE